MAGKEFDLDTTQVVQWQGRCYVREVFGGHKRPEYFSKAKSLRNLGKVLSALLHVLV